MRFGFAEDEARTLVSDAALRAAREGDEVDHAAVAALKRPVLEALFLPAAAPVGNAAPLRRFTHSKHAGGECACAMFAVFESLHEHSYRRHRQFSWPYWPEPMRDPGSAAVAENFARDHAERVEFFNSCNGRRTGSSARRRRPGVHGGLSIGLYRDAAVGANPHGRRPGPTSR